MTSPAVTIRAEATTEEAGRLMYRYRIASLPVVDSLGRLIGIISQGDVLDSFHPPGCANPPRGGQGRHLA